MLRLIRLKGSVRDPVELRANRLECIGNLVDNRFQQSDESLETAGCLAVGLALRGEAVEGDDRREANRQQVPW
jgi:hypothetical protein